MDPRSRGWTRCQEPLLVKDDGRPGARRSSFGIESGNAGILKTVRKGITRGAGRGGGRHVRPGAGHAHGVLRPRAAGRDAGHPAGNDRVRQAPGGARGSSTASSPARAVPRHGGARALPPSSGLRILTGDWSALPRPTAPSTETGTGEPARCSTRSPIEWEERFNGYLGRHQGAHARAGRPAPTRRTRLTNLERIVLVSTI
ncbi:MAG: hypothetical protein M0C28_37475 [Candidatus Moduliflexus flocculans]|nr:hypothetical protein [Candidatus Moduliflexus flocculans]